MSGLERLTSTGERVAQSVLDAAGAGAARIASLWWLFFWVCSAIFILVIAALAIALYRGRVRYAVESPEPVVALNPRRERSVSRTIAMLVGLTIIILFVFLVASEMTARSLASIKSSGALTIELTGYRWWWRARYLDPVPERIVVTANEVHIPVGKPVMINTYSRDVIH